MNPQALRRKSPKCERMVNGCFFGRPNAVEALLGRSGFRARALSEAHALRE
jgi:hypothetical protein